MADEDKDRQAAQSGSSGSSGGSRTVRYDVAGWRERARSEFGRSPHAVVGALAGQQGAQFTAAEVKSALRDFDKIADEPEEEQADDSEA